MSEPILYIDRENGQIQQENVYGETELVLLYETKLGEVVKPLLTKTWFSQLNAQAKVRPCSKETLLEFAKKYDVCVDEAEKPIAEYQSLDDFFCRKLKPGSRPLEESTNHLCSPADGRALAYKIDQQSRFFIKNHHVNVAELLKTQLTEELVGGNALVIRLAPKDYHRFHFPCEGIASEFVPVPGPLESVHPIALSAGAKSFLNKRTVLHIDTECFGRMYFVAVGALTIGTIVNTYSPGKVKRGDEVGYFRFGGSTIVMLWGKSGPSIDEDIWANTKAGYETLVKYGSSIASFHKDHE